MNPYASRGGARMLLVSLVLLALVGAGIWFGVLRPNPEDETELPLSDPLTRGPLRITVMESGSLEATDQHNVVNEVEGRTTIDFIIEEGTMITPEDVAKGLVLVRLNSATIEEKRINQEIELASALDQYSSAVTSLEIQLQQNASDQRKAELDVRFARLDLARYVGKPVSLRLLAAYTAPAPAANGNGGGESVAPTGLDAAGLRGLISGLLESAELEGEALQKIRELNSEIHLADEEYRRAEEKVRQSERLEGQGYLSREELEADRLALQRREIERQRSRTAREQYVDYDFPKEVEKLLSGVVEAEDQLSRVIKKAAAEEAQKRSAVVARKQQEELKRRRLQSYVAQEKACVLKATVPGLVVYASSGQERRWGNDERIQEGASVREGQALITIPLARSLGARINVHETVVDRVREGQQAWVIVDAIAGRRIPARVASVARLPNPADRWLNPDLKVYTTMVELEGEHPNLKPGMSAQVEILVTELQDVIAVPIQAVAGTVDAPAVWVWEDGQEIRRSVKLGLASDHFVSIAEGLQAGERVLLAPPREKGEAGANGENGGEGENGAAPPARDAAPEKSPGARGKPEVEGAEPGSARPAGGDKRPGRGRPGGGGKRPAGPR